MWKAIRPESEVEILLNILVYELLNQPCSNILRVTIISGKKEIIKTKCLGHLTGSQYI